MTTPNPTKIVIDDNGDLMLNLHRILRKDDETETFVGVDGKETRGTIIATMKVSRQVLMDNSRPFKAEFTGKRWKETDASNIDVEIDTLISVEVVLRAIHNTLNDNMYGLGVPISEVWEAIQFCDYRQIEVSKLNSWFAKWLERKDMKKLGHSDMKQLLFPCYTFDHAYGFAFMTRSLAYQCAEHTTEWNPTEYRHLHLDGNAVGAINGARGSMRGKLLRGLFNPVGEFLRFSCDCKEKSLFAYNLALSKTGIWPLHDHHKKSVQQVLDSYGLANFECKIPDGACSGCRSKLSSTAVLEIRRKLLNDFHGLCLDCMKMTKTGDIDDDYWEHDFDSEWDVECRINHSQPTWYFSFMGRKTDMAKHQKAKRDN
ncbi:hypothetical protein BDZ45DRAFT_768617 [Acephala macrosclerotiorum]|nr:hypothetical protein BDZ45DRAFT_768617 [Acephala macrosclerotiorum]